MPGPYAHLAVTSALHRAGLLEELLFAWDNRQRASHDLLGYCLLGTVSPDFPNLAPAETDDALWADAMHHGRTGQMIMYGIDYLRLLPDDSRKSALLAWLLGYSSHVVTDATIHPVVRLKVGDYEQNVRAHRLCELHQDYHIAHQTGFGDIGAGPKLNRMLLACADPSAPGSLAPDIAHFWTELLRHCHSGLFASHPPDIHGWYRQAVSLVAAGESENRHLFPLARVILERNGLRYPDTPDPGYVAALPVPGNQHLSYDALFAKARFHTMDAWHVTVRAIVEGCDMYRSWFGDWDLDTGCNADGRLAFW